jgi:hypothetical protein
MQVERPISVALMGIGVAVVLPQSLAALRGDLAHLSGGRLLVGDLAAALALYLWSLALLDGERTRALRMASGLLLGVAALAFAGAAGAVALRLGGTEAALAGLAALVPLGGFGLGAYTAARG